MSKTVHIESPEQFNSLLSSSRIVVVDFYADWCGPCKAIAPLYEQLSASLSRPNIITFTKVNTDTQQQVAQTYGITAMPTFMIFKNTREVSRIRGANAAQLSEAVKKLAAEAESGGSSSGGFGEASSSSGAAWLGASLPRGYGDVTDQIDVRGLDLLNADTEEAGDARTLFALGKPSAPDGAKGKAKAGGAPDWVESDTDEQLMLYVPFQSTLKLHTIHLTSFPPQPSEDNDEVPMRPRTVKLFTNRAHNLGFEEAEDIPATQEITIKPEDWDASTGTAKLELRFVKFQNITSLVMFVVDGEGDGEKVRLDRIRIIGESGEKREMGKLEKIGDEA
ncbi:thioredoxin [Neofusicoccum parvum]|uniref:Thioredoxin n=2 Tax=Neofusicoccum parvum TaxID=310453 RepID=A0ACB5RVR2_9PEZI|nr:putative thioredoxin domain containing protein [Neofusicoccum parvum UCRNP2]GME24637.1 thioredoxin [Neofusicoccum parvum]GME51774.1 thioredoxin [Neofusicoccum parvum]